ncbi:MAG: Fic family protein [Polyangia bacterium]
MWTQDAAAPSVQASHPVIEQAPGATKTEPQREQQVPSAKTKNRDVERASVSRAAAEIFKAVDGLGTDEEAIHRALRGRTPAEAAAIREEYRAHYGRDLDQELASELSGHDLEQARAALSGDRVKASAAALVRAASGVGTDKQLVFETLRGLGAPQQRRAVAEEYQRRTGKSLDEMLRSELSGTDHEVASCLAAGRVADADAARLDAAMHKTFLGTGLGTDEKGINEILDGAATQTERQQLAAAYQRRTGRSLLGAGGDLQAELSGADYDLADGLTRGDRAQSDAARLHKAAEGAGTDEAAIFGLLAGKSEADRRAMVSAYKRQYGDLGGMLGDELSGMDAERAQQLLQNGRLDPAFAMRYAMQGIGTDEELLRGTLRGMSQADVAALRSRYLAHYGTDLEQEMRAELSGRDEHYLLQNLKGEPMTLDAKLQRAREDYDFERGSGAGFLGPFVNAFYDAGGMLDRTHQRQEELRQKLTATSSPAERAHIEQQLLQLVGYQAQDTDAFHAAQDSVSNKAAMATALTATAAVTLASGGTGGAAAPAIIQALAGALGTSSGSVAVGAGALAGGMTSMGTKRLLSGEAYGAEDMGADAAMTAVSSLTGGLMASGMMNRGLAQALAPRLGTHAQSTGTQAFLQGIQGTGQGVANGVTAGLVNEDTWRGTGNRFENVLAHMGPGIAGSALSGAGTAGLSGALGAPAGSAFKNALTHGGMAGGFGGALQAALDPMTYEGRWEDGMLRLGVNAGQSAIQSGLINYGRWRTHTGQMDRASPTLSADVEAAPRPAPQPAPQEVKRPSNPVEQMIPNLRQLWDRPLPPEARLELEGRWKAIEAQLAEIKQRQASGGLDPLQAKERIDALRMGASGTARGSHGGIGGAGGQDVADLAQTNFRTVDQDVQKAAQAGEPLTVDRICQLNAGLGRGLENNRGIPGQLRERGQDVNVAHDFTKTYVPGQHVGPALAEFTTWYNQSLGTVHPIELAAQAYQRLVSIHPFSDANGRTCRMVMDWILQSHGLPPAVLQGDEINVALFGLHPYLGEPSVAADHATRSVTQGLERSLRIMGGKE